MRCQIQNAPAPAASRGSGAPLEVLRINPCPLCYKVPLLAACPFGATPAGGAAGAGSAWLDLASSLGIPVTGAVTSILARSFSARPAPFHALTGAHGLRAGGLCLAPPPVALPYGIPDSSLTS